MLKKVLKEISTARALDIPGIAQKLGITENFVKELISQLERMGFLDEDKGSYICETRCSSCKVSNCNIIAVKTLTITKKGEELLKTL